MAEFCRLNDAEFYRYVDDMSIAVDTEVIGKKALKTMTESLRNLNLVSTLKKHQSLIARQQKTSFFSLKMII